MPPVTFALDLKSTRVNALLLPLRSRDVAAWEAVTRSQWGEPSASFDGEGVVLDARALPAEGPALDWSALLRLLASHGLQALGVLGADALSDTDRDAAQRAGLALLPTGGESAAAPVAAPAAAGAPSASPIAAPVAPAASRCLLIDRPLRSGQQVYARDADLIVLGLVSHGAEVIADGHIHVYGALRGRAIAGAKGNTEARVFAQSLEPELIAIAGTFRTSEKPLPPDVLAKPAQVRLDGERLVFEPLKY